MDISDAKIGIFQMTDTTEVYKYMNIWILAVILFITTIAAPLYIFWRISKALGNFDDVDW